MTVEVLQPIGGELRRNEIVIGAAAGAAVLSKAEMYRRLMGEPLPVRDFDLPALGEPANIDPNLIPVMMEPAHNSHL